jgi:hypothetical protein
MEIEKTEIETKAQQIADKLCELFNCKPVQVRIKKHLLYGREGYYFMDTIWIAEKIVEDEKELENTILHEFAHHLHRWRERIKKSWEIAKKDWERVKKFDFGYNHINRKVKNVKKRNKYHNKEFAYILAKVIERYYGDFEKYSIPEYKKVKSYLEKRKVEVLDGKNYSER